MRDSGARNVAVYTVAELAGGKVKRTPKRICVDCGGHTGRNAAAKRCLPCADARVNERSRLDRLYRAGK